MVTLQEAGHKLEKIASRLYGAMVGINNWEEVWGEWDFSQSADSVNYAYKYNVGGEIKSLSMEKQLLVNNNGSHPVVILTEFREGLPEDKKFKKIKITVAFNTSFKTEFEY